VCDVVCVVWCVLHVRGVERMIGVVCLECVCGGVCVVHCV